VQDALQAVFLLWAGEYGIAHLFPVQAPVSTEKVLSERPGYPHQRRSAWLNNFMCNLVGIDDGHTPLRKQV
jgi:hypothetical protein